MSYLVKWLISSLSKFQHSLFAQFVSDRSFIMSTEPPNFNFVSSKFCQKIMCGIDSTFVSPFFSLRTYVGILIVAISKITLAKLNFIWLVIHLTNHFKQFFFQNISFTKMTQCFNLERNFIFIFSRTHCNILF